MSIKALQDYTVYARYAKYNKELKRRETWDESVDRLFKMHEFKYADKLKESPKLVEYLNFAKQMVLEKRVLGSQRALQFGGDPILKHEEKMYNCAFVHIDRPRAFQELMYLLLCGCGVGFSVQQCHTDLLPTIQQPIKEDKVFIIEDSIEGWADAVGVLVNSYFTERFEFPEYNGHRVVFDYSKIRPEGAPISGGFKAPGSKGLQKSLEKIRSVLSSSTAMFESTQLRPIDAYDIIMHSSDAVLSGGVRRSATLALFSIDDEDMINAKTGDWVRKNPQRARSNNSAALIRSKVTREQFARIIASTKQFGEPGFLFIEHEDIGTNPCFAKDTLILTDNGYQKIYDLYNQQCQFNTIVDKRIDKDNVNLNNIGTDVKKCTNVHLTQTHADIYEVTTEHGLVLQTTNNHTYCTTEGRKQLKDIEIGEKLLLQSGRGGFGKIGDYKTGLLLGLLVGDGTLPNYNGKISTRIILWGEDIIDKETINEYHDEIVGHSKNKFIDRMQGDIPFTSLESVSLAKYFESLGINLSTIKYEVPTAVLQGSAEMMRGYLHGLIYTDGSVPMCNNVHDKISSVAIYLSQHKPKLLGQIQLILLNFGIVSRIYQLGKDEKYNTEDGKCEILLPNGRGGTALYRCNRPYELIINRPNMVKLEKEIGLFGRKAKNLKEILDTRGRECYKPERYISKIISIKYIKTEDVYCFTEPETNSTIANGLAVGQCAEIGLYPKTKDGRSGVQFCNLTTKNASKCKTKEDFLMACKASAILGTIQAGYTNFTYLSPESKEITEREALIGCSMTGVMENPEIILDPKIQREGAELIKQINAEVAAIIGINPAARCTTLKPEGTTSCLLGTSSGIHPHHARRYIRRVQANKLEFPVQYFQAFNPLAVEESVWSNNKTDMVINFLCEVPRGSIVKNQISAIELLEKVKLTQTNWVESGTHEELCVIPGIRHNVSNTITVKEDEWDSVEEFIWKNRKWFSGVSLLPFSGDLDYPQAPFATVLSPAEIAEEYGDGSVFASGLIVHSLRAFNNNLWAACDAVLGRGLFSVRDYIEDDWHGNPEMLKYSPDELIAKLNEFKSQGEWVKRAIRFADKYFNSNIVKMTHCLKHVHTWKTWCDLRREYKEIDWKDVVEDTEYMLNIDTMGAASCSGGKCELI